MQIVQKNHKTFDSQYFSRQIEKEKIKIIIKAKFIYYAIKAKKILITIIFSFILTLKNIII